MPDFACAILAAWPSPSKFVARKHVRLLAVAGMYSHIASSFKYWWDSPAFVLFRPHSLDSGPFLHVLLGQARSYAAECVLHHCFQFTKLNNLASYTCIISALRGALRPAWLHWE